MDHIKAIREGIVYLCKQRTSFCITTVENIITLTNFQGRIQIKVSDEAIHIHKWGYDISFDIDYNDPQFDGEIIKAIDHLQHIELHLRNERARQKLAIQKAIAEIQKEGAY